MILNHTPLRICFEKEFSAGCQPRYPVKIPITTWKSLSPPRGLQLYPSCQARCPVKTSYEMENYPAPSAAQLLTMLLHREHCCSYFYYTQFSEKNQPIPGLSNYFQMSLFQYPQNKLPVLWTSFLILIDFDWIRKQKSLIWLRMKARGVVSSVITNI